MASRFTFTEKQFNEIKRLMAPGPQHKSFRQIGAQYDLGKTTLGLISRSVDFHDYRRKSLIRSSIRRVQRQRQQAVKRSSVVMLAVFAAVELIAIVILAAR
jgi:hypothetical protein